LLDSPEPRLRHVISRLRAKKFWARGLPLLQAAGEQVGVVDDLAFEESVELFGVDAVGSFYLAVEPWRAGFNADVVDAGVEQVPMELGTEL
jgi:hypothetical protein